MRKVQSHRGPDAIGYSFFSLSSDKASTYYREVDEQALPNAKGGLAFNRLSIQDLSAAAHQPMVSRDGKALIVFNGEIYNAADFRRELEDLGCAFRTTSDTEVILNLYQQFGHEEMLRRLNGMFCLSIVDLFKKHILLARDRLGIKPLYLYQNNGLLLFSSELKSFYAHPDFSASLSQDHMDEFLTFRYCASERTLLNKVTQLEPGHYSIIGEGGMKTTRYWSLPAGEPRQNTSLQESVGNLETELLRSVRMRLLSDVPLGCQLSGGIDSSIVNIYAGEHSQGNLKAFSVVMDDPRYSEQPWIQRAAEKAQVESNQFNLGASYFIDHLDRATWHMDAPLNHPNSIGLYFLAENSRKQVTVLLSGEGADELLGGYPRYPLVIIGQKLGPLLPILGKLPSIGPRLRKRLGAQMDSAKSAIRSTAFSDPESIRTIYPEYSLENALKRRVAQFSSLEGSFLTRFLNYERSTYMVELLIRQDKMTMAHSLENRVPFLDHKLVEFVGTLPDSHLVTLKPALRAFRERNTKVVLKNLASKYFDEGFVYRQKEGFSIPLREFFSHPRMKERMEDELLPGIKERGLVSSSTVRNRWEKLDQLSPAELNTLWMCVSIEVWAKRFLSNKFHGGFADELS